MKTILAAAILTASITGALADPQLTSWFTLDSGNFAKIYLNNADKDSGTTATTWSNGRNSQSQPAYSGVQEVLTSSNWIYVRSTGLGSHVMGPWQNGWFPNLPTDQHFIFAMPRRPQPQTGHRFNHLGEIGMSVDGVRIFDSGDSFSYSHRNNEDADPRAGIGRGDQIWNRDAFVNESPTFDASYAHQQNWGRYHYHAEPIALRYLLGDHVDYDAATKTYHESTTMPTKHSPILGWMQDGYPVYGPYGYSNPTNPASGLRRMVSGYVVRDGQNGTDNLNQNGRRTLPAWDSREMNLSAVLPDSETGPDVNGQYSLGRYMEDYAYLGDLGKTQGRDFDLDEFNGRWCVTPEFPNGTYAYFTTIDANGKPIYPYNMGRRYYGNPTGRLMTGIHEPVTTNFVAHPNQMVGNDLSSTKSTTLTWNGENGYTAH